MHHRPKLRPCTPVGLYCNYKTRVDTTVIDWTDDHSGLNHLRPGPPPSEAGHLFTRTRRTLCKHRRRLCGPTFGKVRAHHVQPMRKMMPGAVKYHILLSSKRLLGLQDEVEEERVSNLRFNLAPPTCLGVVVLRHTQFRPHSCC